MKNLFEYLISKENKKNVEFAKIYFPKDGDITDRDLKFGDICCCQFDIVEVFLDPKHVDEYYDEIDEIFGSTGIITDDSYLLELDEKYEPYGISDFTEVIEDGTMNSSLVNQHLPAYTIVRVIRAPEMAKAKSIKDISKIAKKISKKYKF